MPVELSVRDVRDCLLGGGIGAGDGIATTTGLGRLFHDVFAAFFETGSQLHVTEVLDAADPSHGAWKKVLVQAAYAQLIGPRLDRDRAVLTHRHTEVAAFWQAVENLCDWIARVLLEVYAKHGSLEALGDLIDCERPLEITLAEPGWSDSVVLRGTADAVIRLPKRSDWCVVELKTGRTAPDADFAQAALYHLMLSDGASVDGAIGLVSFKPDCHDRLVKSGELRKATTALKALIGKIAGVAERNERTSPSPQRHEPVGWKTLTSEHSEMRARLIKALGSYGLAAAADDPPALGPTFIRFLVKPAAGSRIARFTGLSKEIAMCMALDQEPMVERLGGHVAIDIERPDRHAVRFDDVAGLLPQGDDLLGNACLLVGVDMEGSPIFADLAKPEHCHLLVAGSTGSGKSIWLRAAIASLLATNTPETLQLVLIDPKRNAFTAWKDSPYLRTPVLFPGDAAVIDVLDELVEEMERRYALMEGLDDLPALVKRDGVRIPRIVCICDEYADLVSDLRERKEIEARIKRLGAKARAAGIHLILATQTPRRDIITGAIKANLPTIIGLRVASQIEARIIEAPGAEHLLGNGDLLFKSIGEARRLQGVLVTAEHPEPLALSRGPQRHAGGISRR